MFTSSLTLSLSSFTIWFTLNTQCLRDSAESKVPSAYPAMCGTQRDSNKRNIKCKIVKIKYLIVKNLIIFQTTVEEDTRLCEQKFERTVFFPDSMICAKGHVAGFSQGSCKVFFFVLLFFIEINKKMNVTYVIFFPFIEKEKKLHTLVTLRVKIIKQCIFRVTAAAL